MSEHEGPVSDSDLNALVDGRLEPGRRAEVEAYVHGHPQARARVEAYRRQNQALHALYDSVLQEPVPARLHAVLQRPKGWTFARVAVLAWLLLGPMAGWWAHRWLTPMPVQTVALLPREAALAHAVYTPEVLHPVEVSSDQEQHLVQWLSKRLGTSLRVPDLHGFGFTLMGGRLLPGTDGPAAQFMYQDVQGQRLTLYLSVQQADSGQTAFRFAQEDGVSVMYWIDGRLGYALSGEVSRASLLPIAEAAYHQLELWQ